MSGKLLKPLPCLLPGLLCLAAGMPCPCLSPTLCGSTCFCPSQGLPKQPHALEDFSILSHQRLHQAGRDLS